MYCISISHQVVNVDIREKFAFTVNEQQDFENQLLLSETIQGCVILSTCNRSEFYFTGGKEAVAMMEDALVNFKGLDLQEVLKYLRVFEGKNAIIHLYSVASGLDSMVLGEDEILGQVKKAYQTAFECGATDKILNMVFQGAMNSAKKVKSQTMLSKTSISIGTLVAHEIFSFEKLCSDKKKKVLIIGLTGKVGTIIMKNILHRKDVVIIGTTRQHGYGLSVEAEQVKVIGYGERYDFIDEADIIISATTSPHYTLTYHEVNSKLHTHKKRLFIDLAVPMDIDKAIEKIEEATLYDMDHFRVLSKQNNDLKLREVERGRYIVRAEVDELMKKLCFNEVLEEVDHFKNFFQEKGFEQALFSLREVADSSEFETIISVIKRAMMAQKEMNKIRDDKK